MLQRMANQYLPAFTGRRSAAARAWATTAIWMMGLATLPLRGEERAFRPYRLEHKRVVDVQPLLIEALPELRDSDDLIVDPRTQQILLRGSDAVHEMAAAILRSIDVPAAPASAPPEKELRLYEAPPRDLEKLAAELRRTFGERIRVASLAAEGRVFISAPPALHAELEQRWPMLRRVALEPTAAASNPVSTKSNSTDRKLSRDSAESAAPPRGAEGNDFSAEAEPRFVPVRPERLARLEARLRDLLGQRLEPQTSSPPRISEYRVRGAGRYGGILAVDYERSGIWARGPLPMVQQLQRITLALDRDEAVGGRQVQVLSVERSEPAKLRTAIEAYRRSGPGAARRGKTPAGPAPEDSGRARERTTRPGTPPAIELANYIFQVQPGGEAELPADEPPIEEEVPGAPSRLRELATDVEIESLPDLNVIILRGREQDVEELSRIIRELERISAETQPEIEVYHLRHTRDAAISELIEELNEELTLGRKGRASVYPLVNPNALLIIGWGDAVAAVRELIGQLDQPVPPGSNLRVFPLRHAAADALATTVTEFFEDREGLGAQVEVTADTRTNSLVVHASPRDLEEVELLIRRIDVPRPDSVRQVRVFPLRNSLADDMADTLQDTIEAARAEPGATGRKAAALELLTLDAEGQRRLEAAMLDEVEITPDVRANALIVTGPRDALDLVALLIEQLDHPVGTAQIKIFRIVNGDAADLIEMLRALLPAPTTTTPPLPLADSESTMVPLRFSLDSRTNSIIASGSAGDLQIVEALLLRLDEKDIRQRENTVYRLRNSPALAVANAVNEFLRSERQVQLAASQAVNIIEQVEREVIVVPEPVSNALIVSATPQFFEEIMDLVEQLDAQPAQVVIQVLIGEVQLNNVDEFGIELGLQDSVLFDRSLLGNLVTTTETVQTSTPAGVVTTTNQVIQAATNEPGFAFNSPDIGNSGSTKALANSGRVGTQGLSNFAVGRVNDELGYGGLVLSASSESVSVLIRALQESRRMEILSRPQITTLDNQPAFIQVGQRVPRVTGSNINQVGLSNTIELENVGLILGVTPRVSPEGMVVMEVDAEKSEVGPLIEGIPISVAADGTPILSPRVNITTAQTTVSAADGETIILGGLITRGVQTLERKVPYLADIPVLGHLFRFDSETLRRSELLIILTPRVIRRPEDMERLKRTEAARMSWCAADLHRLHGDTGLCQRENCPICEAGTPVIYPDLNPRGVPLESVPIPEAQVPFMPPANGSEATPLIPQDPDAGVPPQFAPPLPPGQAVPGAGSEDLGRRDRVEPIDRMPAAGPGPATIPLAGALPAPTDYEERIGNHVTRVSSRDPRLPPPAASNPTALPSLSSRMRTQSVSPSVPSR